MLALTIGLPADQVTAAIVFIVSVAVAVGAFFAGRGSFRKTVLDNAVAEAKSWKSMYEASKEQNASYELRILDLVKEGHDKDLKIAELSGKISVIESFMAKALGKEFTTEITKTSTTVTGHS